MNKHNWPLEGVDIESIRTTIDNSARLFQVFVSRAGKSFRANKVHALAAWSVIAADVAWNSHAGLYSSPALENMLLQAAQSLNRVSSPFKGRLPAVKGSQQRVLHILSMAYPTGGHTRVAQRWIQNTRHATHSVVIIGLENYSPPPWLRETAEGSGGWLLHLDDGSLGILDRARALRDIACEWADLIVLHTHPNDPVPILAFGVDTVPPVILFNHADHVFWLGASIADIIADVRPTGQALTRSRRGRESSIILPIPMTLQKPTVDRATARRQLGLGEKTTVLLSIAASYKFAPLGGYNFLELNRRVLDRHPDTVLLVVGPSDSGRWAELRSATNGRVRAFGEQRDLDLYHAAADIYLDSFPFASLTSMFEVGLLEKPVIGLANPLSPIHSGDDISLNRCATHFNTREEYEESLHRLIADDSFREERGKAVAQAIQDDHLTPGWEAHLTNLMAAVPVNHSITPLAEGCQEPDITDIFLTCIQKAAGMSCHIYYFLENHIRYLPAGPRYFLALENMLQRGIFSEKKLNKEVFRSYKYKPK